MEEEVPLSIRRAINRLGYERKMKARKGERSPRRMAWPKWYFELDCHNQSSLAEVPAKPSYGKRRGLLEDSE